MTRLPLAIAADHPAFDGHFPGRPILPGVVLLDHALKAIASHADRPALRIDIGSAKFLSPVGPGEPLRLEVDAATTPERYRVRLFAGDAGHERLAMSGDVLLASAPIAEAS